MLEAAALLGISQTPRGRRGEVETTHLSSATTALSDLHSARLLRRVETPLPNASEAMQCDAITAVPCTRPGL